MPKSLPDDLKRLELIVADAAYQGRCERQTRERLGVSMKISRRRGDTTNGVWALQDGPVPEMPAGFNVVKLRWIVERTFAWLGRHRRLSKDYEHNICSSTMWLDIAFASVLLARFTD